MPKSNVTFHDSGANSANVAVSIDKFGRIMLSSAFRDELQARDIPIKLYLGYDSVLKRIHLVRADTERIEARVGDRIRPYNFDKSRGYTYARAFLDEFGIPHDKTYRYVFVDKMNGAYVFEREDA